MLLLSNVAIGYSPSKVILTGINFEARPSEIHVLMGLNGSGKSSFLKTAMGLLYPLEGQVIIENNQIQNLSHKKRAQLISFLESSHHIAFRITVKELVKISQRLHGDEKIYRAAIEALDLGDLENKNLLELSSGEIKRAFVAHALCSNSKIILLDEPLSHLDWSHQSRLVQSLKSWREKFGTTFVLAIHELEWIPKLADYVTVLGRGRVVTHGSPETALVSKAVSEVFAFRATIDQNPIDGSKRLTLGK